MFEKLLDICNSNFVKCDPNISVTDMLSLIADINSVDFVLLEDDNKLIGLLTSEYIDFALLNSVILKKTLCKDFINLSIKRMRSNLILSEALVDMISCKVDSYVVTDANNHDVGIVTKKSLLEYFIYETPSEPTTIEPNLLPQISKAKEFFEDLKLIKAFKAAQLRSHVRDGPFGPIIVYEPEKPISTSLPYHEIVSNLRSAIVKDCNTIYEETFHVSKKDLIDKKRASDRLPDNVTNQLMLKHFYENNNRGYNVESHEHDSLGNDLWFLNNTFYEVVDGEIIRLWVSKQDITYRKNLEEAYWKRQEQFEEMFKNSLDNIFMIDVFENNEYRFHQINPACEKNIGISNDDIIKLNMSEFFNADTALQINNALNKCLHENKSVHIENELIFPAGRKSYSTTLVPVHSKKGEVIQIIGVAVDITDKRKEEINLRHLNWALLALSNGNSAISRATSEISLIQTCCQSITSHNEYFPLCGILEVTNIPKQPLKIYTLSGSGEIYHDDELNFNKLLGQKCILKAVFSKKSEMQNVLPDKQQVSPQTISKDAKKEISLHSVLAVPLISVDKVVFVFVIYSNQLDSFREAEIRMFEELCNNIILGIEYKRTQASYNDSVLASELQKIKLERAFKDSLEALGAMLESRDPYTSGHQKRVADLAVAIAKIYALDPGRIQTLYLAASVHDIGKVTVPSEILSKPSELTDVEFAMIKVHPESGYQVLKNIEFPGPIADIVHQHHEYLDGSGYPLGLKGNQILLESKILTVADIVEAMSSHRPYRPALGVEFALNEIKKMRGIKLDAKAVDICVDLFENLEYAFPEVDHFNQKESLRVKDKSRLNRSSLN